MVSLVRLRPFLRPYRGKIVGALSLLVGMVAADLLVPRLTQRIIDQGILASNPRIVWTSSLLMLGAALVSAVLALLNNSLSVRVAAGFGADLREALMAKVLSFSPGDLARLPPGALLVRSTSDVTAVQSVVMMGLRIMTRAPIWVLGAALLLLLTSPRLAGMAAAFLPVIFWLVTAFARRARPLFAGVQAQLERLNSVVQENLSGVRVVRAFVREAEETRRFEGINRNLAAEGIKLASLSALFLPATLLVLNLAVVGAVWWGGVSALEGELTVGEVVAAVNYLSFALFPLFMMAGMTGSVAAADASASRILEVLDLEPQIRSPRQPRGLPRVQGRIEFQGVSFAFPGAKNEPVLSDLSFAVEPGETVAVVGSTGSGKSTLLQLIPRFYDPTRGSITLDGVDLRELDLRFLRSQVGIVFQDNGLFQGTVRENLSLGKPDASLEEVEEAARAAEAHEFILALPQGYETPLGGRGFNLSGGQRQRIALARALLTRPKILLLDDAMRALDVETELRLQDALDRFLVRTRNQVTRMVVAHRLSTVLLADRILLLDQGRLVGEGTHQELLAANPWYREMYASQVGRLGGGHVG